MITLSTGAGTFLLAMVLKLDTATQVMLSVFVAGVSFVATYLVEVDRRLGTVELNLKEGFRTFSDATEVFSRLAASGFEVGKVTRLIDDMASIDSDPKVNWHPAEREGTPPNKLVLAFAQRGVERLAELMHDLRHSNESVYEGEDRDWMLDLTHCARTSIHAVSLTTVDGIDGGLWMTDLGHRYLQRQEEAVARKVSIKRVFIAEDESRLTSPDFLRVCEMHSRLGVEVKILDVNVAPGILANTMFDFIVFDGAMSYESMPASHVPRQQHPIVILTTRLVRDRGKVRDRVNRFEKLWEAATEFKGLETQG